MKYQSKEGLGRLKSTKTPGTILSKDVLTTEVLGMPRTKNYHEFSEKGINKVALLNASQHLTKPLSNWTN